MSSLFGPKTEPLWHGLNSTELSPTCEVATRRLKSCTVTTRRAASDAQSSPNLSGCRDYNEDEGHLLSDSRWHVVRHVGTTTVTSSSSRHLASWRHCGRSAVSSKVWCFGTKNAGHVWQPFTVAYLEIWKGEPKSTFHAYIFKSVQISAYNFFYIKF